MKEEDWQVILAKEQAKIDGRVPMSHQMRMSKQRWGGPIKPAPPNCHGAYGKPGFKRFFKKKFGRPPTWDEEEYCRQHSGKPLAKLAEYWKKAKKTPPVVITASRRLEAMTLFTESLVTW